MDRASRAMTSATPTHLPFPRRSGKVRDVYDLGEFLLIVSTDRISAFDWVLPTPIPDKGRVLTQISAFWFEELDQENHLISTDLTEMNLPPDADPGQLNGRTMLVRKTKVVPIECVVRGYLAGSGWKDYCATGGGSTRCSCPMCWSSSARPRESRCRGCGRLRGDR